jgi:hypothetical protein
VNVQLAALKAEKASRTPAQRKIDSHLLYAEKKARKVALPAHMPNVDPGIAVDRDGQVVVDVRGRMTTSLLQNVQAAGGQVTLRASKAGSLRVRLPLTNLEEVAASPDVRFISPPVVGHVETGTTDSEGDTTHRAISARSAFGVSGVGIKVGVLSDGVQSLAASQTSGDLGPVTVLPGQAGPVDGDEGTAMLEIVQDIAPSAQLYFATAVDTEGGFAQNIRDLASAGCKVIIDDVGYFDESPFQDGPVAQAVNDVTAAGVLYFSSSGNSGNLDDGTSGVWEGNFTPYTDGNGDVWADFDPTANVQNADPVRLVSSTHPATLQWADPYGASANDYDLYLVAADGATVLDFSNNTQDGTQDPFEGLYVPGSADGGTAGRTIAILRYSGASRFMDLSLNRGSFAAGGGFAAYATAGQTKGHSAAAGAFSVAATPAHVAFGSGPVGPYPGAFSSSNVSETFTSDGPRRMFYAADGTPYTPGNFTSTGGIVRQKPDLTAADGVQTTVPGFQPFFGTSAAAPHAGAIAALLLQAHPGLTPAEARAALTSSATATDIEAAGWDRDTGSGIIDAYAAVQFVRTTPTYSALAPYRLLDTRSGVGAPTGKVAAGGTVALQVTGRGGVPASGVSAVVLNVTVTAPTKAGYVTAYGYGTTRPGASNLNFLAGQTVPNLVVAPVGARGKVALYNGSAGTVNLIADVSGYYLAGAQSAPGAFGALAPARLLDTRSGVGAPTGAVAASGTVALQITGRGGVPASGVSAVVLNVTVTAPTRAGYVTAYGDGTTRPEASNLNFLAGQTVPNLVIAPVGANGKVALYNGSPGTVQMIADVSGYYVAGSPAAAGAFGSLAPSRLLDTRSGVGAPTGVVAAGGTVALQVTGRGGVPASGVSAVVLNVTVTRPTKPGYITVYGDGTTRPTASNLNFVANQSVPNLVIAPVGANGKVALYNGSTGTVHLIADVSGYYLD